VPKDLGPGDVLLASYGLLTRETSPFDKVHIATLVIDEAQAIKNADTQRAKSMRAIKADWTIALTGTPLENHLADLWSLFRVVTPGFLGSWDRFRDRFATPIERHASTEKRRLLSRLVRPFLLRRTKSKVLSDLPAKTDIDVNVELSDGEKALYEQARLAAVARIKKADGDARFIALAALTTLRRLVCHPRLYDAQSTLSSSKLETFLRMLDELRENHHRALVFSQFTSHLALIQEALDARGITYQYLDGQTPERERSKRVDAFQRGEGLVFLVSLKAGGTGLNLTAADFVFHLDPWWNPAVEEQASSRAHRMGQTRPVTVYRLIARGTVEEKIVALHRDKRELAEALIGETDSASKVMGANEIISLLQER
jgi:SNF2 family DNA or RNA helicase